MNGPRLVAGVDSSTQSTKVLVVDADSGGTVREGRAAAPRRHGGRPRALVAGAALRHERRPARRRRGDRCGRPAARDGGARRDRQRRTTRAAVERQPLGRRGRRAGRGARRRGGMGRRRRLGSGGSLHGLQAALAGRARAGVREPDRRGAPPPRLADRSVDRPESTAVRTGSATTDRGDASGTGYWSPRTGEYRPDLVQLALGHESGCPACSDPDAVGGT